MVKEGYVLSIPDNLPLDAAAPLLCAGITLYSPLRHWNAGPGKKVAIVGMGGLGHMGVKIAHAMGADVTVLSQTLSKKDDGTEARRRRILRHQRRQDLREAGRHLRPDHLHGQAPRSTGTPTWPAEGGRHAWCWSARRSMPVPVNAFSLIPGRRSLSGSMIGSIKETQEMLDFCGQHNIVADIETIDIKQINEAYERVLKSDVRYRFVIDIASLAYHVGRLSGAA